MISSDGYFLWQPSKYIIVFFYGYRCLYSVKNFTQVDQFGSEYLSDGLLSQTYTENRFFPCISPDNIRQ